MLNNTMSILFASGNEAKLNELTIHRTTASLPFGGRYRLIDFALSNFVNSGITTIGLVTKNNYNSLMDHIRMGRDWDLNRKNSGLIIYPPFALGTSSEMFKSKIEAIYSIRNFIEKTSEEYVVVSNSNVCYNIDYEGVFDYHIEREADITILTYKAKTTTSRRVIVKTNNEKRVSDINISEKPSDKEQEISLNIYLLKKSLLWNLVERAYDRGDADFEKDILMKNLSDLKIYSYELRGYAAIIDDVKGYYNESMKLLDNDTRNDLFFAHDHIYTKVKDSVPAIYKAQAHVKNSLVADGCEINGTVVNSILFRGVKVEEGAVVKNSIIMENGIVMRGSSVSYAITDKNVVIRDNRNISGYETYPIVIVKDKIV
jgi:glucose-1-phosphate adenylyltransferase